MAKKDYFKSISSKYDKQSSLDFTRCIFAFIHHDLKCAWIPVCFCDKHGSIYDNLKLFKRLYGIDNLSIKLIHDSEIQRYADFSSDFFEDI